MKSWNLVLPSPSTQVETAWNDICPTLEVEENTVAYANRKKKLRSVLQDIEKISQNVNWFPSLPPPSPFLSQVSGHFNSAGRRKEKEKGFLSSSVASRPQETKRGKYRIYTSWSEGRPHGPETVLDFDFSPHLLSQNCNAQKRPNQSWFSTRLCHCLCRVRY